jgi:shikimate kinase
LSRRRLLRKIGFYSYNEALMMAKPKNNNIFLVGPMGAGKSSVGRYLAKQLKMDFYDTDEEVENRTGVDLAWIFDVEGEDGFRKREALVVADLAQLSNVVLATGGGTVMTEENREILAARGTVVYLEVTLGYQHTRVINDSRRPLLHVKNRAEVLERLQTEREPHYAALADFTVPTDNCSVRAVADEIINWFTEKAKS